MAVTDENCRELDGWTRKYQAKIVWFGRSVAMPQLVVLQHRVSPSSMHASIIRPTFDA